MNNLVSANNGFKREKIKALNLGNTLERMEVHTMKSVESRKKIRENDVIKIHSQRGEK